MKYTKERNEELSALSRVLTAYGLEQWEAIFAANRDGRVLAALGGNALAKDEPRWYELKLPLVSGAARASAPGSWRVAHHRQAGEQVAVNSIVQFQTSLGLVGFHFVAEPRELALSLEERGIPIFSASWAPSSDHAWRWDGIALQPIAPQLLGAYAAGGVVGASRAKQVYGSPMPPEGTSK